MTFNDAIFSDDAEDDEDYDDDDEQTDGISSSRRKLASVFIVSSWTLGNPIAPDFNYDDSWLWWRGDDFAKGDDKIGPDCSHGEELASHILLGPGLQVWAFADVPIIRGKDTTRQVFFLASLFIFGSEALGIVVTPFKSERI